MNNQPIFKTNLQTTKSINYIAYGMVAIGFYFIFFFVNLYMAKGPGAKSAFWSIHLIPVILAILGIPALIYLHIRNQRELHIYQVDGNILMKVVDRFIKVKLEFNSPFEKEFYYIKENVSKGYMINALYISFYKDNEHILTLRKNDNNLTPPPVIFKLLENLPIKRTEKVKIYYASNLEQIIPHLY